MKSTAKKRMREEKQLRRLRSLQAKPEYKGYFFVMMALIFLFQIFDMMATSVYSNLQEVIVTDFAGLAYDADVSVGSAGYAPYQNTLSTLTLVSLVSYGFMAISPWYKSLADKLGRRPFFVLNSLLLGVGMFIGGLTRNLYVFAGALTIILFFTMHDMQILYITECVPSKSRGTWQGVINAVGGFAGLLVVLARFFSLNPDGSIGQVPWRSIFIGIGIFGLIIFVVSFFLLRESRPFLKSRIAFLEQSPQERAQLAQEGKSSQAGVISGIRLVLKNKQLRWLSIATLVVSVANNMICSYNNSIMAQNGFTSSEITIALVIASAMAIIVNLVMGPLSDKVGRKWTSSAFCAVSAILFLLFVYVSPLIQGSMARAIFAGASMGAAVNGYMVFPYLTSLMMSESCPAAIRGSIIGVRSFFNVTAVIAMVVSGILFRSMPVGQVCIILSVPFLLAASVILMVKTKETKGLSMEEIEKEFN